MLLLLISFEKSFAQEAEKTFYIGHSLINLNVPAMTHSLSLDEGITNDDYKYQIGNGANLWYQWDTTLGNEQGTPYQDALPTGTYDNLIITEAVPLKGHIEWSYTYIYANNFFEFAYDYNADTKMYIYETWHCINSGKPEGCAFDPDEHLDWRQRLDDDLDLWEGIADNVLAENPGFDVNLIPGGQGMAKLYDAIQAGSIPGKTEISQFYSDDIHLTNEGNYYISCIMFACIYETTPVGLTNQLKDEWGSLYPAIEPVLALRLQELAWETVCGYERSGVECSSSNYNRNVYHSDYWFDYPNQQLIFNNKYSNPLKLMNISGQIVQVIYPSKANNYPVNKLPDGLYFLTDGLTPPLKIVVH